MPSPDARGPARIRGHADASDPVLMAKMTMPDLPGWAVVRPRIERLIAEGARGPLTSVTGPPGAGKTMAIAAWAAANSYPCTLAWVTLDDYDNRPRVFWSYVVAALRRAGIAVPRVLPGPGRLTVDHVFLAQLASVLAAQAPPWCLSSTTSSAPGARRPAVSHVALGGYPPGRQRGRHPAGQDRDRHRARMTSHRRCTNCARRSPDDGDRAKIAETLVALQAVRSAMEAERVPGDVGPQQPEVVRSRLFSFESSLRTLREADEQYP